MARNKNTGNNSNMGDDIEPMWVSPESAEDDWDDDFSSESRSARADDAFDAPSQEYAPEVERSKKASENFDDFDDFNDDFSAETTRQTYDDGEFGGDESDDEAFGDDNEFARSEKPGKRSALYLSQPAGSKNLITYAVMGGAGLVVLYMGYNMFFGGEKSKAQLPAPPVNVAKKDLPKPQPVAGLTPVDLQQSSNSLTVPDAQRQDAKGTPPLPVAQPIGSVPQPIVSMSGGDVSADLATLATSAPSGTQTPEKAPDVPLPTGMVPDTVPIVMSNGMPTLPVGADAATLAKTPEGGNKDRSSDELIVEIGDKLLAEFRSDMDRFKTDMNKSVKETIQDDMAILRVQVEGLNRRVETIEQKGSLKSLEETLKKPQEQPQVKAVEPGAPSIKSAEAQTTQEAAATKEPAPKVSDALPSLAPPVVSPRQQPVERAVRKRSVDAPEATMASSEDDKALKPIEPIKIKKSAKQSANTSESKTSMKKKSAAKADGDSSKDFRSDLPLSKSGKDKSEPTPFQKMAKTTSAQMYELRGVSAGTAWVAAANSGNIMTVSRGDFLPGMGRITEIRRGFSGWEVITEKGILRQ